MTINIRVGMGEFLDKATILAIKAIKITDEAKLANVLLEADMLRNIAGEIPDMPAIQDEVEKLTFELKDVNLKLWEVEDKLRECEKESKFDNEFIELARSVYKLNDERAALKRRINELFGSEIVEEKSYQ